MMAIGKRTQLAPHRSINGDQVTIHNLRNCDYITKTDYTNCWSDRTVYLSQLRYADLFFTTWGPKYIGHPIVSFQFGDHDHVAFSIEARYKVGQCTRRFWDSFDSTS